MEETNNILSELKDRNTIALETMEEVVRSTTSNKVGRYLSSGFYLVMEYLLYAIALVCVIFIFTIEKVAPFTVLRRLKESELTNIELGTYEINNLSIMIRMIIGILALFIVGTAYYIRKNRKYKASVQDALLSLRDVKTELENNNKQLDEIESATSKVMEASMVVANEAKLDK